LGLKGFDVVVVVVVVVEFVHVLEYNTELL
jgi:hypothetical protein